MREDPLRFRSGGRKQSLVIALREAWPAGGLIAKFTCVEDRESGFRLRQGYGRTSPTRSAKAGRLPDRTAMARQPRDARVAPTAL
jgi:hypothetical protein